jgi:YidC/Oxa1 family membrane protein insertase
MSKLPTFLFSLLAPWLPPQGPSNDVPLVHQFGPVGAPGSFRARFSPQGAGLVLLQTTDHFVSLGAARKATKTPDDFLLLGWGAGNDHALRLREPSATPLFPQNLATDTWNVEALPEGAGVRFWLDSGKGLVLTKTLRHVPAERGFALELELQNRGSEAVGNLGLELGGIALANPAESSLFGNPAIAIAATVDGQPAVLHPAAGPARPLDLAGRPLSFAGSTNRFFGAFLWPRDDAARAAITAIQVDTVPARDDLDSHTKAHTVARPRFQLQIPLPPKDGATKLAFGLYVGPKSYRVFATLPEPERFAQVMDVDLNAPCCGSVTVPGGRPMAKLLLQLLGWFFDLVGNWGVAIMLLTILVRGLLSPLNFKMQKSMRAYSARMAVLKPKLDALKTKYADDPKAYQQAMIALQREHKLMPPIGGCLPIFLTMPIYLGLFTALRTAYDLRHQPFVSWVDDLSRADALFQLGFWPHDVNLLPILWIAMFVWMQLRMPLPTDPQARQMQTMMRYMPILFGVMLYGYASALLVYMITSMLWSLVESAIVKRILGPVDPNVAAMAPQPVM